MRRIAVALIALAGLGLAGWYGGRAISGTEGASGIRAMASALTLALPSSPQIWSGRIDYRKLDRELAEIATRPEMAGLAVAIVEAGELRFIGTYGVADRLTGAKVTPHTLFRWASVSKTAAGTLAATLAEDGALDIERPVANWPTSLRLPGGAESVLTMAQLLSHQTGLTKNAYDEKLEGGVRPDMLRAALAAAPLQCPPGTCHSYQNIAFDAASEIMASVTHEPYEAAVRARLFAPLGMKSARFGMAGLTGSKDWARPYDQANLRPLHDAYWRVPAAAGVSSDIVDFSRWLVAAMGERPEILNQTVLARAQSPRVATPRLYGGALRQANANAAYGLGWRSFTYGGHRLIGHSGAVDGYRATLIFDPSTRTGVVAMWNSNWGWPFRIPFAVFDSFDQRPDSAWLDLGELPPLPAPSLDSSVTRQ
jgi:beta-lactamase class C